MRVYERGSGETRSCGTGTVAAAAAAARVRDRTDPSRCRSPTGSTCPGGTVEVELTADQAYLTGPGRARRPRRRSTVPERSMEQPEEESDVRPRRVLAVRQGVGGHRRQPGIGRALATALAEAGSDVVLLVRDPTARRRWSPSWRRSASPPIAVPADVTDADEVRRAVGEIVDRLGQVDVLVNNAGACIHRPALEVTAEEWRYVMDVNVNGVWHCAQAFGRQMVAQRSGVDRQHRLDLGPDRQPAAVAAGLQRLQGRRAPADQVAGRGVGAARGAGERAGPRLHQDRDGAGGRARVPPALDRGRARCSATPCPPSSARAWSSWPPTRPAS